MLCANSNGPFVSYSTVFIFPPNIYTMKYAYIIALMLVIYFVGKLAKYPTQPLPRVAPRLSTIKHAAELASMLLQLQPDQRIMASDAMKHSYFADLPEAVHLLKPSMYYVLLCMLNLTTHGK